MDPAQELYRPAVFDVKTALDCGNSVPNCSVEKRIESIRTSNNKVAKPVPL
jgi:hypothetical protein